MRPQLLRVSSVYYVLARQQFVMYQLLFIVLPVVSTKEWGLCLYYMKMCGRDRTYYFLYLLCGRHIGTYVHIEWKVNLCNMCLSKYTCIYCRSTDIILFIDPDFNLCVNITILLVRSGLGLRNEIKYWKWTNSSNLIIMNITFKQKYDVKAMLNLIL